MRKYLYVLLLLPTFAYADYPIHLQNVTNFAREIDDESNQVVEPKWVEVMKRQPIVEGHGKPTFANMLRINSTCNAKKYSITKEWPTPEEFAKASSGDCKGFAICKYYALRKAGFKAEQLNLWVGDYDGHSHMILAVSLNDKQYVLDVGAESNLPLAKDYFYNRFQPAYRFNEKGWDVN